MHGSSQHHITNFERRNIYKVSRKRGGNALSQSISYNRYRCTGSREFRERSTNHMVEPTFVAKFPTSLDASTNVAGLKGA
jgi:hypothetical protein